MSKKTILYILVIIIITGSAVAFYGYREFNRRHEDITDIASAFNLEATQLIQEFTTDEKTSNARYLGKVLTISGRVKAIEGSDGLYTISLGDTTVMSSIRCSLDSLHSQEAAALQVGAQIAVKGYCSGFNADELLGSDVFLSRCAVEIINPKK